MNIHLKFWLKIKIFIDVIFYSYWILILQILLKLDFNKEMNKLLKRAVVFLIIVLLFMFMYANKRSSKLEVRAIKTEKTNTKLEYSASFDQNNYLNKINASRINNLFEILKEKELVYQNSLSSFKLHSFKEISEKYPNYLEVNGQNAVMVTENFLDFLKHTSHMQTFVENFYKDRNKNRELTTVK